MNLKKKGLFTEARSGGLGGGDVLQPSVGTVRPALLQRRACPRHSETWQLH